MTLLLNSTIGHIIQKQSISISFENPANALGLQNRIADLFYERVQPQMEALFNEMADADHNIKIETLEIDCGIIKGKHWEEEWVDTVLFQLKQELNASPKNKTKPGERNSQFFYFLEAGHLSWDHSAKTIAQLEEAVFPDQFFFEKLEELLRSSVSARKRLINQLSE
ncbi:MAG TPA: contractile injection system tape measure protein, partial [Flavisolibacter sp.]|nr:contractile injection system tape measure protein [Flavisolibacter sp.]